MVTQRVGQDQDSLLDELVQTCNELKETSRRVIGESAKRDSDAQGYCGPFRWRQSCDQAIATPRQTLTFRLELNTTSTADFDDVFNVRMHRELPENLIFERIASILVDGQPSRPTSHSLSRTLDLGFNRIAAGSVVVVTYKTRVHFKAEPTEIHLDDLNIDWSWVSRSRKLIAHDKHMPLPATHVDRSSVTSMVTAGSLQSI